MDRDDQRIEWNMRALRRAGFDALVCTLPMNVLLLSGYWPVVGTSIAILTSDGGVSVLAPEDEKELANGGWADDVKTFTWGSLTELLSLQEAVRGPLKKLVTALGLGRARIGFELGPVSEPSSYAAMNLYAARIDGLLQDVAPDADLAGATEMLTDLRKALTSREIARVRRSCSLAAEAFDEGRRHLLPGIRETEAANAFRTRLSDPDEADANVDRCDGFAWCMSGENSYDAYAAFQRSRQRRLRDGDLVLIHCNSYIDGFWADITRTYCMGGADEKKLKIYDAILLARGAAIEQVRPGVKAKAVDAAARDVLTGRGFGRQFVHGLGHAVGFHAIDHNAPPRLHPASPEVLEEGMVFNVEPAVYIKGYGGVRHCDMVTVTSNGAEVLTPFQYSMDELILGKLPAAKGSIW